MKKLFLGTLFLISILFISGCGDTDSTRPTPPAPEYVFNAEGDYNMTDYLFPLADQVNFYEVKTYHDKSGSRKYTDFNESHVSERYDYLTNTVSVNISGKEERKYTINDTNITMYDTDQNKSIDIVKFIDVGNFLIKEKNYTYTNAGESKDNYICKLNKNLGKHVILNDIQANTIRVTCDIEETTSGTVPGGDTYNTEKKGSFVIQYAEGVGVYTSTMDTCKSTTLNGLIDKKCTKVVTKLLGIAPL